MDGVGCHANVVACHRDGLDVIVTCLAAIRMLLGAIAIGNMLGCHRDMVGGHMDGIVCDSNIL